MIFVDPTSRDNAMLLTLALTTLGALLSAVASWGSNDTVYIVICAARFIIGLGVGGVYPLSATKASEETAEGDDAQLRGEPKRRRRSAGKTDSPLHAHT